MFETILFPIDQSRQASETTIKAIELAQNHNSQIIMLSVVQPDRPEMNNSESVTSLLTMAKEKIKQAGIKCDAIEREGKPAFVICDVADELNVDVIPTFLGAHDIPPEYKNNKSEYIELICNKMIPIIAKKKLFVEELIIIKAVRLFS